jgi:O-antigen/teichoic acid export membrane protein
MASALTTLAVLAIVGQIAGGEALGLLSIGFAVGQIGAVLAELGLTGFVVREGARSLDGLARAFNHALGLRLVTAPAIATLGLVIAASAGSNGVVIWLAGLSLILQSVADLSRSASIARRRGEVWATHAIVENTAWLATIGGLLAAGSPLAAALAGGCLVMLVSAVAGVLVVTRTYGVAVRPRPGTWAELRDVGYFAAYSLLGTAYLRSDTLLVAALVPGSGVIAAGAYYAAVRLLAAFEYVPEALSLALLPELSDDHARNAAVAPRVRPAARLLTFAAIPFPFLMLLVSGPLLELLFGDELAGFGWVLASLSVLVPIRCFQWLAGAALTATDRQPARATGFGVGWLALVAVDVLLIPRLGVVGAVAGSAVGVAVVAAIYASRLREITAAILDLGALVWSVAASSLAYALALFVLQTGPVLGAGAFGLVYLLAVAPGVARLRSRARAVA